LTLVAKESIFLGLGVRPLEEFVAPTRVPGIETASRDVVFLTLNSRIIVYDISVGGRGLYIGPKAISPTPRKLYFPPSRDTPGFISHKPFLVFSPFCIYFTFLTSISLFFSSFHFFLHILLFFIFPRFIFLLQMTLENKFSNLHTHGWGGGRAEETAENLQAVGKRGYHTTLTVFFFISG
jgi:hypothetical protein